MPKLILNGIEYANNKPDGYPPLIYSDEEREVGVWRDGKPLYEKTFVYNISQVSDWTLFGDSVSYDLLVDVRGYHKNSVPEVFPLVVSDDTNPRWCIQPDHKLYYFINNNITRSGYITVQYTKTTDTPGSGTWTTQGAIAHHYSTDEHIIGTWIDGKPLYEKTLTCTATQQLNNSAWTQIQWDSEPINIYQLINAELNAVDGVPNTVANIRFFYDNNHICGASNVTTGNSIYSGQIVTFRYTKTTD